MSNLIHKIGKIICTLKICGYQVKNALKYMAPDTL